jgi:phage terminase Nu1 subunit (DNA packaging protein)|tara:strand:- start:1411 stop:1839 length:429 start_codon:yes stop_codon:yes gene_type:complete
MSITSFRDLISRNIVTRKKSSGYSLDEVRQEYIKHIRAVAANRMTTEGLDLANERARLAKEQADAKEMENEVERGELVYIKDVALTLEKQLYRVRSKLLAIPNRVAPECNSAETVAEVQDTIERSILEVLDELRQQDEEEAG